ncbi:phospholipase D-like domain-containing protein [Candidatus Laterigemmans baculatus]|uniref:phospholipase D-like domain-containing protein n=1 Tax=Candidatus Laterigemmans baculatus TaxID=2770505 RepID=UPI0013D9F662|nr:phospholipase D-like domain-containing protein [Candidatus Laterigemmans baculatus]
MYLLCFTAARDQILLANSYFAPNDRAISALVAARECGVRVEIMIPGRHLDVKATRRASRSQWGKLLEHGVEMYLYQPTMFHAKYLVIDDRFLSLGSANFDERSFPLNDEANLNVYDPGVVQQQIAVFRSDRRESRRYTLEEWQNRSWKQRTVERIYGVLRSQV